jgi:deoxyribonuclease-4
MILLGSHVRMTKPDYLIGSVNEAISYGSNAFMFYLGSPQTTLRTNINNININEFRKILYENKINIENVIVHSPYIINPSSNDTKKQKFAISFLKDEIERIKQIGCKFFVLHPGNAVNIDTQIAIQNTSNCINEINHTNNNVIICIETMSGKGSEIGKTFEEIKQIIDKIENKKLIGVCLDTCHIHDAGYDVNKVDEILDMFDQIIGLNYLKVIHLNDSLNIKGAHKDRHANIGKGKIGFNTLKQ